jgi:hypothetical protein
MGSVLAGLAKVVTWLTYMCAAAVAGVLLWQAVALFAFVTLGPGAPNVRIPIPNEMNMLCVGMAGIVVFLIAAFTLRRTSALIDSSFVVQVGTSLFAVAMSYRFLGLLLLVALVTWRLRGRPTASAAGLWTALLLLSLLPIDISLRRGVRAGAGLVMAEACLSTRDEEANVIGEVVCVSGGPWLYSEPRWVWVW